jgi:serine/threonine protein phosphatase PrpC
MCSDGVHGFVSDDDLEQMLGAGSGPDKTAQLIVEKAIANNSDDNCTALVVAIEKADA